MDQFDETKISELRSEIEGLEDSSISELPFELFEKQGNRTTKLIATSGDARPIEGRRRWHDFKFREPVLVSRVLIEVEGYSEFSEFEFKWEDERGRSKEARGRPADGVLTFTLNDLCTKLSFNPPSQFFSKSRILTVRVEGINRENLPAALDSLSDMDSYRAEVLQQVDRAVASARTRLQDAQKADAERSAIQREITQLKGQLSRLKKNVDDISLKRSELIAQNGATESSIEDATARLETVQGETSRLGKRLEGLKEECLVADTTLRDLRSNINLFPSEIVSFVDQGSRNIRQYIWLAAAPIAVIVVMFVLLVQGAADLTTVVTNSRDINMQALILSRIPYVAISLAIVTACYKLATVFISEIMKINNQRLNLTKLSIIAKDVSTAAEHDLSISDDETYRLRAELKMAMLKDHLKEYISKDIKLQLPRRIVGNLPFLREGPVEEPAKDGERG